MSAGTYSSLQFLYVPSQTENSSTHKLLCRTNSGEQNQPISVYDFNISNMFKSLFFQIFSSINRHHYHHNNTKWYSLTYKQYNNYNAVVQREINKYYAIL